MARRTLTAVAAALLLAPLAATAPATADAPVVTADPAAPLVGAPLDLPLLTAGRHAGDTVADRVLVDHSARLAVRGRGAQLLGTRGRAYLVRTRHQVVRLSTAGPRTTVARGLAPQADTALSADGRRVAVVSQSERPRRAQQVRLVDTRTGRVVAQRRVPGPLDVLAVDGSRVTLARLGTPDRAGATLSWRVRPGGRDRLTVLTRREGYRADPVSDRLASTTRDGCTVVSGLRDPGTPVWSSCEDNPHGLVDSFGPHGQSATRAIAPGGAPVLQVRDATGTALATLAPPPGAQAASVFGDGNSGRVEGWSTWDGDQLLVGVASPARWTVLRCSPVRCDAATPSWTVALSS